MQTTRKAAWYKQLPELTAEVEELKSEFVARCATLEVDPGVALREFWKQITAQSVQESNWQEGIELNPHRTRELANLAFDHVAEPAGPHIDLQAALNWHGQTVRNLIANGASTEEIAAYNLSAAHFSLGDISGEVMYRRLVQEILTFQADLVKAGGVENLPDGLRAIALEGQAIVDRLHSRSRKEKVPLGVRYTEDVKSADELIERLEELDPSHVHSPMRVQYIHFLHSLTLTGIIQKSKLGRFRRGPVHVGNPDIVFPPASAVPAMMEEYCRDFPDFFPSAGKDPIMLAARYSHRFVKIHPYADGNGRVSRLLMNFLLISFFHPPVYLKADKKGRHRYIWSLHRADRGNYVPLAALIADALVKVYKQMLEAMSP